MRAFWFIHHFEAANYAKKRAEKRPMQQISNGLFPVISQRLLCSLCSFDKSSKATGNASLCVVCRREMNGYSQLHSGLLYPVPSEKGWRRRES